MLVPRKVKFRKPHHPSRSGASKGGTTVNFGDFGIQALAPAYVTNRQIEAARIAMTRYVKRGGKVWIYKGDIVESRSEREAAALAGATTRSHRRATANSAPVATLGAPADDAAGNSATEGGQA